MPGIASPRRWCWSGRRRSASFVECVWQHGGDGRLAFLARGLRAADKPYAPPVSVARNDVLLDRTGDAGRAGDGRSGAGHGRPDQHRSPRMMDAAELARRVPLEAVDDIPAEHLPAVMIYFTALQGRAAARLATVLPGVSNGDAPAALLDVRQAAEPLGVPADRS